MAKRRPSKKRPPALIEQRLAALEDFLHRPPPAPNPLDPSADYKRGYRIGFADAMRAFRTHLLNAINQLPRCAYGEPPRDRG